MTASGDAISRIILNAIARMTLTAAPGPAAEQPSRSPAPVCDCAIHIVSSLRPSDTGSYFWVFTTVE